jgi:hypothetical protein
MPVRRLKGREKLEVSANPGMSAIYSIDGVEFGSPILLSICGVKAK